MADWKHFGKQLNGLKTVKWILWFPELVLRRNHFLPFSVLSVYFPLTSTTSMETKLKFSHHNLKTQVPVPSVTEMWLGNGKECVWNTYKIPQQTNEQ